MTRSRASRRPARLLAAALAWALAACSQCSGTPPAGPAPAAPAASPATGPAPVRSLVAYPTGGDAHPAHAAQGLACAVCHDCGQYAFQPGYRLPSGTPIAGGTITRTPEGTTCAVACHAPFGGAPAPIRWDLVGPLACVDCHVAQGPDGGPIATGHVAMGADAASNRAQCRQCHDTSAHLSGAIRVIQGDGAVATLGDDPLQRNALCRSCHDGAGRLLDGHTAPLLQPGWADATAGDWHGARPGPVFGTALLSPWATPQGELACTACHDPHRSANAFLLGDRVNGAAVPPGAIGRNGAGAEALCATCHAAPFHRACVACHTDVQPAPTEVFDPAGNHLDPAPPGAPCFWCHGHEGVRHVSIPVKPPGDPSSSRWLCDHCHRRQPVPALDLTPPVIAAGSLAAGQVGETAATVTWLTDEPGTSEVQWGVAAPTRVTVSDALVTEHAVTLTGLTPGTTYQVRVRSQDAQRNVGTAGPITFTTLAAGTPTVPVPRPVPSTGTLRTAVTVTFAWSASTGLPGHALQYRVQVGHTPDLATPFADSGWLGALSWSRSLPAGTDAASATWWWRVQARDPATGATSAWSAPGTFSVWQYQD